ncbi:hypothetical protein [Mucilaginibacter polytrichastri]|uniref:hypothetical protein n=1 Tax=Mucilaginibacter polytrichastri TaxID=1302689 RepID=UPI0008E7485A|nr:hypothetical protein [Mucilaginibacter polytrichastri]SFT11645.1 hypothetical protein SAMN04487890_11169 [Mucilaginibacter polytrichastri]
MKLTITAVDYAPEELYGQIPFEVELLCEVPGSDRPDYWIGKLHPELKWIKDSFERKVTHVVIATRWQGTSILLKVKDLPVGISYVTDLKLLEEGFIDFNKLQYVAIAIAHETAEL